MAQAHRSLTLAACLAAAVLLSGCPAPEPRPMPPPGTSFPESPPSVPAQPAPAPPRENHLSAATHSLVTQARTLETHGDLDGASSTLDRALRIEPNNPLLWIEIGRLRLAENDAHQAEGCGRKALVLASGDRRTQAQAGHLLADALRAEQRNQEASEVEHQPFMQ
ncbi:MAG TPA: tetratricopeptide repeat protein [Steroidobacteraceae bacterium]|jgi:tetratricopeptide (TPR) repeat protein